MKQSEAVNILFQYYSMMLLEGMEEIDDLAELGIDLKKLEATGEELSEEFGCEGIDWSMFGAAKYQAEASIEALVNAGLIFEPED